MSKTIYHIFCDESRQTKDRFMVIGAIIINQNSIDIFNDTMKRYRAECKMTKELKWSKISNQKYGAYKLFIDYFFSLNNNNHINFKCLIIDNNKVNHRQYNKGDKELGFYKFTYQLLLHSFGKQYYNEGVKYIIHLDQRDTKYKLSDLKEILNNGISKRYNIHTRPFVNVEGLDSKKSDLLQINDIILGSISYQKNKNHLVAGTKKSKMTLSYYILKAAGIDSLDVNTPYSQDRFSIWNFNLRTK